MSIVDLSCSEILPGFDHFYKKIIKRYNWRPTTVALHFRGIPRHMATLLSFLPLASCKHCAAGIPPTTTTKKSGVNPPGFVGWATHLS
ncbi:MAG: hypothetical protein IPI61_01515 [Syntrophaceae bacterium]|nr:hypothetical protein [Syntrophaceae bacterium]